MIYRWGQFLWLIGVEAPKGRLCLSQRAGGLYQRRRLHHPRVAGLDEDALTLHTWDGAAWVDAASTCTPISAYQKLPAQNQIGIDICHLSQYALFAGGGTTGQEIYLPLVTRW